MDQIESVEYNGFETSKCNSHVDDRGWKKVVYRKRNRKQKLADQAANGNLANGDKVIRSLEEQAADVEDDGAGSARFKRQSNGYGDEGYDFDDSDDEIAARNENLKVEETKKPKVAIPKAAAKIDPSHLAAFLVEVTESNPTSPVLRLMGFIDYFGSALSGVSCLWQEMFKESVLSKLFDVIDVPLSHIPEPVYKTSVDWINQQFPDHLLCGFVLWAFRYILNDVYKGPNGWKEGEKPTDKSNVAIFVALAMVVRSKPRVLTRILPSLRKKSRYQGQGMVPITVWMIAQASQDNLSVGLYSWAHNLLPLVGMTSNPQSWDLILKLVEKILSKPEARTRFVNARVWVGQRLIPPPSFEILLRLSFPASSARVMTTRRFEAIYPLLKEVALAGAPESEAMKQVIQQIFTFSLRLAGEGNPVLAKEATTIAIWSLTENVDCWKPWDNLYEDNLEASVALLKKL